MHTYTIDSNTYIVYDDTLFKIQETVSSISELEEGVSYLNGEQVGVFDLKSESIPYSSFDAVFTPLGQTSNKRYYTEEDEASAEELDSVEKLERLVPDDLEECPECGASAGAKKDDSTPQCFNCGFGIA